MSVRRLSGMVPYSGQYTTPGAMSHRVNLYTTGTRNTDGTYNANVLFATSWAAFRTLMGRELDQAQTIRQQVQVVITIPYLSGVSEAMTMTIDGGTDSYQILYINDPDGRKVELRIYASLLNSTVDQ